MKRNVPMIFPQSMPQVRYQEQAELPIGEVSELYSRVIPTKLGGYVTERLVRVGDESDPFDREILRGIGDAYEDEFVHNPSLQPPKSRRIFGREFPILPPKLNRASKWLYSEDHNQTSMREWAKLHPSAKALYSLQRLDDGGRVLPGGFIDERAKYLFTNMVDGIGLRSRARIYREQLVEYASEVSDDRITIASLGSGAAVPNIDATLAVEASGKAIDWKFFDFDPDALKFARELIEEADFTESTVDYGPMEIDEEGKLQPKGQNYLRAFALPNESVDIVDALGLWEYLNPSQAEKFARALYMKLKPGGRMIVSNMLPDRPQRYFNEKAVGWPNLFLRSQDDLIGIVSAAGIMNDDNTTMTHSEDGVYVVMEIRKT